MLLTEEQARARDLQILIDLVRWLETTEQLDEYVMQALLDFARTRGLDLESALAAAEPEEAAKP